MYVNVPYDSDHGIFIGADSVFAKIELCSYWLGKIISSFNTYF